MLMKTVYRARLSQGDVGAGGAIILRLLVERYGQPRRKLQKSGLFVDVKIQLRHFIRKKQPRKLMIKTS